jgi:hypothetical protein
MAFRRHQGLISERKTRIRRSIPLVVVLITGSVFLLIRFVDASIFGVPPGYTGSPVDGTTCATMGCHRGPVSTIPGWITTNIPPNGYLPSDTYNVTLTATRPNTAIFGFQITAQGPAGIVGEFLVSDWTQTQYAQGTGYVTHKAAGTAGNNQKSWQMKWIAPADTGEITVTFYAAVVVGYFDQDDEVFLSTRTYTSAYQGVGKLTVSPPAIVCYPVPFGSFLNVEVPDHLKGDLRFDFFSSSGALLLSVATDDARRRLRTFDTHHLPEGLIFLAIKTKDGTITRKLIKKSGL